MDTSHAGRNGTVAVSATTAATPPANSTELEVTHPGPCLATPAPGADAQPHPWQATGTTACQGLCRRSPADEILSKLDGSWVVRGVLRDRCGDSMRRNDTWVVLMEDRRQRGSDARWGLFLLYNLAEPPCRGFRHAEPRWEYQTPAARREAVERSLAVRVYADSPVELLARMNTAGLSWPGMTAATVKAQSLHTPALLAARVVLALPGAEGDAARMLAGLGAYVGVRGASRGIGIGERAVRHALVDALDCYAEQTYNRHWMHESRRAGEPTHLNPITSVPMDRACLRWLRRARYAALLDDVKLARKAADMAVGVTLPDIYVAIDWWHADAGKPVEEFAHRPRQCH